MTERFQSTLPPDIAALATLRRSLSKWLEIAGVADPRRGEVVLATHEGAANAIEHSGNASAVGVRAQVQDGTITIEISDSGRWAASSSTDGERGRGLMLIAGLVSSMELRTDKRGTLLRLVHDA